MSAAAIIQARRRRLCRVLWARGAVDAATAVTMASIGHDRWIDRNILRRLVRSGIVVQAAPETYYLDVEAYKAHQNRLRWVALIVLGITVLAAAIGAIGLW